MALAYEEDDDYNSDSYDFDGPDGAATTIAPSNVTPPPPPQPRPPSAGKQRPVRREEIADRNDREEDYELSLASSGDGYRDNVRDRDKDRNEDTRGDNDNDNDRYRDERGGSARGRPRGRSATRSRSRSRSRSQSPPEFFYDENGQGWVSHRERPISRSNARSHSHSHHNIHESRPTKERRPVRPRPASASIRGRSRKPRKGSRAARLKKQRERAQRLERLSRPKAEVDRGVSSTLDDCENCTFAPQITRYAEQRAKGQRDFMSRVPGYIEGFLIKKKQENNSHLQFSFKPKLNVKTAKTAKERQDSTDAFQRRNKVFMRNKEKAIKQHYASDTKKVTSEEREHRQKSWEDFSRRLSSDIKKRDKFRNQEPAYITQTPEAKDPKTALKNQTEFYERMNHDAQERRRKLSEAAKAQEFSHQPRTQGKASAIKKKADKKVSRDSFLLRYQQDLEHREEKLQSLRKAKMDLEMRPFLEATVGQFAGLSV